jgi:hypothetical protein
MPLYVWDIAMPGNEIKSGRISHPAPEDPILPENSPGAVPIAGGPAYDPELLYVECHVCGKPVLWEPGRTTQLLLAAGVDLKSLDERCLLVSEGCPACHPEENYGFILTVVRIAGLTAEEAEYMARPAGSA